MTTNKVERDELLFAKLREDAIIPSKREEDAGYDIYANFDSDFMVIEPHTTKKIPTGIASACSDDYVLVLKERGSTGSKGIAQRCGIIDSGYRGEWFVPLTNTNVVPIVIVKKELRDTDDFEKVIDYIKDLFNVQEVIIYPYEKAICQLLVLPVPKMKVNEVSYEELKSIESERGTGALGSSNK